MKNNRQLQLTTEEIENHQLSREKPPGDALFWQLWEAAESIAQKALRTDFIQGIQTGTLHPVTYGSFNVSDAYYCFRGAADYQQAANRATHPVLKLFLKKKYQSYQQYNATFPDTWHLKNADGIAPSEACLQYAAFESAVAREEAAIYTVVAMLPCEYLWAWLAAQLAPPQNGNLYADWITGNNDPGGAYAMGNFLEAYCQQFPVDVTKAQEIYRQAMTFEYQNFATA